jgi:hypothetical protein
MFATRKAIRGGLFAALLLSTVATGCDAWDADRIGPEGGMVVSADGRMALEIPEGALDESVEITIEIHEGIEGALTPVYVIEPVGLAFQFPTELVFDYDDEALGEHDPEALELATYRELGWDYLPDRKLDQHDQTISVSLMALSAVTLVVE